MMVLRSVRGIDKTDSKATSFLDLSPEGTLDRESASYMEWIHNAGVQQYLGSDKGVFKATLDWHSSGVNVHHPQFESYFLSFEDKVLTMVRESIDADLKSRTAQQLVVAQAGVDKGPPWLLAEVRDHLQYAKRLESKFSLAEVDTVFNLLSRPWTGARTQPAFLLGAVGSGKTTIVAAVAMRLSDLEHARSQKIESSLSKGVPSSCSQPHIPGSPGLGRVEEETDSSTLLVVFDNSNPPLSPASAGEPSVSASLGTESAPQRPHVVIVLFCNTTARSRSARGVLSTVSAHLSWVISNIGVCVCGGGEDRAHGKGKMSYEALVVKLPSLLRDAGAVANITILIDGLEECAPEHRKERNVEWIPTLLPPHVRLLVSLSGSISSIVKPDPYAAARGLDTCSQLVKDRLRDRQLSLKNVIEVPSMSSGMQKGLTEHLLSTHRRRLTKQYETQLGGLVESSLMLFLSLCLRFLCWVQPPPDGEIKVPRSLFPLADTIFETLSGTHGEAMVECTLGFLCAAFPLGVTEMELLDLVSCCDRVLLEEQDTGFTPSQKRVSRRQWACLKGDLIALGWIIQTTSYLGTSWSFTHLTLEAIIRDRLVSEGTLITCLKHLAGLYSGKLKDTMGARMVLSCLDDHYLGPSHIPLPVTAARGGGAGGSEEEDAMESKSAVGGGGGGRGGRDGTVMHAGGGFNLRRLTVLPATMLKLTSHTVGQFADPLTTLLTDSQFVDESWEAGLGEELVGHVAAALSCISLLPCKRAMVEGCLTRLAALVASSPWMCGRQTFAMDIDADSDADLEIAANHQELPPEATATGSKGDGEEKTLRSRPLTAQSIASMLSGGPVEEAAEEAATLPRKVQPALEISLVKEQLMEWEVERFAALCLDFKKILLQKSRDPFTASLATIPDVVSVKNLRWAREQVQQAGNAEEMVGLEPAWTAHSVLEMECMSTGQAAYRLRDMLGLLVPFLKQHLKALTQTQMILLMRTNHATNKTDHDAWHQAVDPQLERNNRTKDYLTLNLRDLESTEHGVAARALEPAAKVHMRWLVNRHAVRWPLIHLNTQIRWLGVANKHQIFAHVQELGQTIALQDQSTHDRKECLVSFPSFLSPLVGCAYRNVGLMSLTNEDLDGELEDLRLEMGMQEHICDDDGFKFANAVYNITVKFFESTGTDFKRKDKTRSLQVRRETSRKSMPASVWVRPVYGRYNGVVQGAPHSEKSFYLSTFTCLFITNVKGTFARIVRDIR
jgi:hypothetical protein